MWLWQTQVPHDTAPPALYVSPAAVLFCLGQMQQKNDDGQKSALVPGALFGAGSLRIHSVLNYWSFHTLLPAPSRSALLKHHLLSHLHSCSLNFPWVQVTKTSVWSQWSVVLVHADLPSLNCQKGGSWLLGVFLGSQLGIGQLKKLVKTQSHKHNIQGPWTSHKT